MRIKGEVVQLKKIYYYLSSAFLIQLCHNLFNSSRALPQYDCSLQLWLAI